MKRIFVSIVCVALLILSLVGSAVPAYAKQDFAPTPKFSNPLVIDNQYMPLVPGTTLVYQGTEDEKTTYEELTVTDQTRVIQGVETRVVHDTHWTNGTLTADTFNWFAQDDAGNVWYFGEDSSQLVNGMVVGHASSWEAGVDGASPGIVMEAQPKIVDTYQLENAPGVAQDMAIVISLNESVCVVYGCFANVVEAEEFSPLEPGVVEDKYYASGVGEIKAVTAQDSSQQSELLDVFTR